MGVCGVVPVDCIESHLERILAVNTSSVFEREEAL
jgi:hypothetical protein